MPHPNDKLLDRLTDMDEILVHDILPEVQDINDGINSLHQLEGGGVTTLREAVPREKDTKDLSKKLDPGEDASRVGKVPFDGWVTGFICGWPDGAAQNAGIGLYHNSEGTKFFPEGEDDYAAFNDWNHRFPVTFPVEKGEELEVKFKNENTSEMPLNALVVFHRAFPDEEVDIEGR